MSAKLKVLLVEDSEDDALLLVHELRRSGLDVSYKRVDNSSDMKIALKSQTWDVVLADYSMPGFDGLSALQLLRKDDAELPFIVVSGTIGEETAVALMKAGAQDYLMKTNLRRLVPAIQRELVEADNKRLHRITVEQLRSSEEMFRTLASVSQVGILLLSLTGEVRFLNDRGCEILGLPIDEVYGLGWMKALHPDDKESFFSGLLTAIEGDRPFEYEHRILHKNGKVGWVLTLATCSKSAHGKTTSYIGTMTDITELKIQQENLSRLNRALSILSRCNELVIRAENEQQLLDDLCQTIASVDGYSLTYTKPMEPGMSMLTPLPGNAKLEGSRLPKVSVVDCSDCGSDLPHGHTNLKMGNTEAACIQQCASLIFRPFQSGGDGELRLYDINSETFTDNEISIFEELAADVSFGIQNLRLREERDRAQVDSIDYQRKLRQSLEDALQALAATLEQRDPYTAGHQERVAELARSIGLEMGLPSEKIHGIYLAGVVHDIGKIHIPAEILAKPSKLTSIEFELIKTHAQAGYDILKGVSFPWPIADIVWQHHERLNGSGYPRGLKDTEILIEAKIISVADVVDAMSSHRPYRAGLGIEAALNEITRDRGTLYDPAAVDACIKLFREKHFEFNHANTL